MKKLVFVMMALIAMSFASCDTNVGNKNVPEQDSITTNVDTVTGDTVTEVTADQVAAQPNDAPAEDTAPAETEEKK
jgi:hypothetical protein